MVLIKEFEKLSKRNEIVTNIIESIKVITVNSDEKRIGKHLYIMNYSNLTNWSPKFCDQSSENLIALSDKIRNILNIHYDSSGALRLLISISNNVIKKQSHPTAKFSSFKEGTFLGYGHFRWNYKAYTLKDDEIQIIKKLLYG